MEKLFVLYRIVSCFLNIILCSIGYTQEVEFLKRSYSDLSEEKFVILLAKLTHLHISEMLPFYIMRYGFYEGHTDYRCDPIAIAFIFGLKRLEEINHIFDGDLYNSLTGHFVSK